MKKVLIGVGIGCLVLILAVVGVLVAGGMWAKGKLEGAVAAGEELEKQQKRAQALNEKFTFNAPPKGTPVKLTDARMEDYLAVRASLTPVLKAFEAEGKKLDGNQQGLQGAADAWKAMGMVGEMFTQLQSTWLDSLESKKMSPKEFHAITAAIFASHAGKATQEMQKGQREMLVKLREEMEKQANDANQPQEVRDMAKEQVTELDRQIQELPPADAQPTEAQQIHVHNAQIFEKYKDRFEKDGNPGIDMLLAGADGANFGEAMDSIAPSLEVPGMGGEMDQGSGDPQEEAAE